MKLSNCCWFYLLAEVRFGLLVFVLGCGLSRIWVRQKVGLGWGFADLWRKKVHFKQQLTDDDIEWRSLVVVWMTEWVAARRCQRVGGVILVSQWKPLACIFFFFYLKLNFLFFGFSSSKHEGGRREQGARISRKSNEKESNQKERKK